MFDKGIIKYPEESCFSFGGGEPTILENFDEFIYMLLDKGCKNIRINTSGIKYSKGIERGLKEGSVSIVISTDSGGKQTYEKIKRVKTYDKVWKNIAKYRKAACRENLVKVKYIILPGINDNYEEIENWFKDIIKNKVKGVCVSVEEQWYFKNFATTKK